MIDSSSMETVDSNGMHKIYDEWPRIARESYESNLERVTFEKSDHMVFVGMGESGAIGDIFSSILSKTNIHVDIVKGYLLPKTVDAKSIVVITSIYKAVISNVNPTPVESIDFIKNEL